MDFAPLLTVAAAMNNLEGEPSVGVVVVTGLVLVFGVLILLYLIITLEGVIFSSIDKKKAEKTAKAKNAAPVEKAPVVQPIAKAPVVEAGIPEEVVAAIVASIACMDGGNRYTLRSLKRVKTGRNAWAQAGVASYTDPF
ncbi:OadG family transporter subunit [uncultured Ruthenibacterium sp.]|uniref:OadG family transporter subunit n=1 Tax=uncultured Ruthenibacterium sp. TaxID=1905347 RepID=UPI00349E7F3A